MSVLDHFAARRRSNTVDVSTRATCLRCRREYTPDPETARVDRYCWWCAQRVVHADAAAAE
jgi:hypothetical protein